MDITFVIGNNSCKFHDDTMMGTYWKRCDGQTDRRTDVWSDWTIHRAVWSQLKKISGDYFLFLHSLRIITTMFTCYNHINSSPPGKMTIISQTIFSDAFSWMKSFIFWLKFHWNLFLRVQLTITQNWLYNGIVNRWIGDKPLSEPVLTRFNDTYMRH